MSTPNYITVSLQNAELTTENGISIAGLSKQFKSIQAVCGFLMLTGIMIGGEIKSPITAPYKVSITYTEPEEEGEEPEEIVTVNLYNVHGYNIEIVNDLAISTPIPDNFDLKEELENSAKIVTVTDIKAIDDDILSELKCGDIVSKEDTTGKHAYIVTFKKDNIGLCLTYADGSGYIETVSYDYNVNAWVYNSTDVFNGNSIAEKVNDIANEDFTKNGDLNVIGDFTADSIIENMEGYSFTPSTPTTVGTFNVNYAGVVKNGNKITFVVSGILDLLAPSGGYAPIGHFEGIPADILSKIVPYASSIASIANVVEIFGILYTDVTASTLGDSRSAIVSKGSQNDGLYFFALTNSLNANQSYTFRIEKTYLLSENLAPTNP